MSATPHRARKRFGQNFLHDPRVIARIVDAIDPRPGQTIVEIGPGQAALTRPLVQRAGHLTAIEIDRDLAARLRGEFTPQQLTLIEADALAFDWSSLPAPLRLVGNLPYNISSPLLFSLATVAERVVDQHFMLQKEVVDRMVAPPGSRTYGRLSVMLQFRYRMVKLFDVPRGAFNPPPQVTSSIVRMQPLPAAEIAQCGCRGVQPRGGGRLRPAPQDTAQCTGHAAGCRRDCGGRRRPAGSRRNARQRRVRQAGAAARSCRLARRHACDWMSSIL